MSRKKMTGPAVKRTKYTKEQMGRGLLEIAGLIIILVLVIIIFAQLAPLSSKSGLYDISVTFVHGDGSEMPYSIRTEKTTLGEVLVDGELDKDGVLDGEEGDWLCSKNGDAPTSDWRDMPLKTGDAYVFTLD